MSKHEGMSEAQILKAAADILRADPDANEFEKSAACTLLLKWSAIEWADHTDAAIEKILGGAATLDMDHLDGGSQRYVVRNLDGLVYGKSGDYATAVLAMNEMAITERDVIVYDMVLSYIVAAAS